MLIKTPQSNDCKESDVTPESFYFNRRQLLRGSVLSLAAGGLPAWSAPSRYPQADPGNSPPWLDRKISEARWNAIVAEGEAVTPFNDATNYNNFYEFGPNKGDPARHAGQLITEPWTVMVDGEVAKPGRYSLEDLCAPHRLEERIYRLRCVEGWSMVIPWLGFSLAELIRQVEPTSSARYVGFETLSDADQMPAMRASFSLIDWPYVEGLRMDEAAHPLTL